MYFRCESEEKSWKKKITEKKRNKKYRTKFVYSAEKSIEFEIGGRMTLELRTLVAVAGISSFDVCTSLCDQMRPKLDVN